jgi:nucleoside-diphosphate-sugar epimerase
MRVVVTGGSGQLGTCVLRKLAGDRSVRSLVSLDVRPPCVASAKLESRQVDVRDADLPRHFQGADAVVHLAFLVTERADRSAFWEINVGGSKNVFEAAASAGVPTIAYASSVAAYGALPDHPRPLREDAQRRHDPSFPYALCKFEVEEFLDGFEASHRDIAISRMRPAILAGERIEHSLGRALSWRLVPDLEGLAPLPFVWDEDVADAFALALKQRARGAYNLAADGQLTAAELARASGFRRVPIPRALLHGALSLSPLLARAGLAEVDRSWLDRVAMPLDVSSERAKSVLGWRPRYPTAEDVARQLGRTAPGRIDPRIAVFLRATEVAARRGPPMPEAARVRARIHLALIGKGGADVTIDIAAGRMTITRGVPRPPDSVLRLSATTLVDMLAGKLTPATAQLTGKVRIEGEPLGNMVLSAMVTLFRAQTGAAGASGFFARQLARWMGERRAASPQGKGASS